MGVETADLHRACKLHSFELDEDGVRVADWQPLKADQWGIPNELVGSFVDRGGHCQQLEKKSDLRTGRE